jgi:hypothetical protein
MMEAQKLSKALGFVFQLNARQKFQCIYSERKLELISINIHKSGFIVLQGGVLDVNRSTFF